jgi:Na+-transporting methylmalonyl-CoA/oxaloacetate decarboxylase gamma subunit
MQIVISLLFVFLIIGVILFLGKTACRKVGQEEAENAQDNGKEIASKVDSPG